ncbi:fructose-2,6-bisphosphatase-like isoform X1 [Primulina huaijiensis]|uniref:fructose-2,6-bisphosphatase-like isoform X1 n=1 Tax=Primulina huaijiensis TaxID=1492673 RepID=UPI003CC7130F
MAAEYSSFLKNKIWVPRHGRSIPNAKGIIISSLENGILEEYRLCPDGIQQARLAGESFLKEIKKRNIGLEHIRICYSPFSRTSHTAKVVASVLNVPFDGPQCEAMEDLRERFFGCSFELMSHDKYPEIWAMDEEDPFTRPEGGESVADVVTRLTRALIKMESAFEDCMVLVVSHGDPLQILQTIINAAVPTRRTDANDLTSRIQAISVPSILSQHRKFALNTGELRELV